MGSEFETAEDRLRDYFGAGASVAGLKSIHGALVDMAQSGASGTRSPSSPEDRWYESRAGRVRRHAAAAHALGELSLPHQKALEAYYGLPMWPGEAPNTTAEDAGLVYQGPNGEAMRNRDPERRKHHWDRSRPPPEVRSAIGPELGMVALLTTELAEAAEQWEGKDRRPHVVLVALCKAYGRLAEDDAKDAPLWPIEKAAEKLHEEALTAFARRVQLDVAYQKRDRKRRRVQGYEAPAVRPVVGAMP